MKIILVFHSDEQPQTFLTKFKNRNQRLQCFDTTIARLDVSLGEIQNGQTHVRQRMIYISLRK